MERRRREIITVRGHPMSLVFQNIDPHPPLRLASVSSPPTKAGGTHLGGEGVGVIFWKTIDIGLPSYSNNLSTGGGEWWRERDRLGGRDGVIGK